MSLIGLEIEDLEIAWRSRPIGILQNFTKPESFQFLPIAGVTGGGKSTLLGVLAGLKSPRSGAIEWRIEGQSYRWDADTFLSAQAQLSHLHQREMGVLLQDNDLVAHLRVEDNLRLPLIQQEYSKSEADQKLLHQLPFFLADREKGESQDRPAILRQFPGQLSGGQRQRMALLQAIIHDPFVLIADEPTSHLDDTTKTQIFRHLVQRVLSNEYRLSFLLWVTHSLESEVEIIHSITGQSVPHCLWFDGETAEFNLKEL